MIPIDFDEFCAHPEPFDRTVAACAGIDRFCSSSAWIVSAQRAFHAQQERLVLRSDAGWVALSRGEAFGLGRFFAALEAMWGLACPLVGPEPRLLVREAVGALFERRASWDALWLGGLVRDAPLFKALVQRLAPHVGPSGLRLGPAAVRWAASLDGGYEGWLGRRTSKFRTGLRRALANAAAAGVAFESHPRPGVAQARSLYERILAVEARSWKGMAGSGFIGGDMRRFYAEMLPRLAALGQLRVILARRDDEDVAFIFGGVLGDTYRGLQVSFDDGQRALGLGNVMQARMIQQLCDEGVAVYDLGSDMEYKARWAERGLETVTLVAFAR